MYREHHQKNNKRYSNLQKFRLEKARPENLKSEDSESVKLKLKFLKRLALWMCIAFTALITVTPALALNKAQSEQAEQSYENALINFHEEKRKEAKIHLKNALKVNPVHLPSRILMAKILIKEGNGAGAEIELDFSRERGADYDQLIVLFGHAYILQGKNKYLLDVINNGNRDDAIEAEISYLRGRAYFGHKKLANAKRSYQEALDRNPVFYQAKLGLAQVAAVHKQFGPALDYIDTIPPTAEPYPNALILKSKIYKQRGSHQKAIDTINEALAIDDTNVMSRLTRAALYIGVKKYDEANEDVDFILQLIPREPRARYLKAVITAAQGDFSSANTNMIAIINILRSVPPEMMRANPTYYYLSGLTNFQFGNLDEARQSLQQYLKLERGDIGAMRLLGALELQASDPIAANLVLSEAARHQPNNPTILTMLGLVYLELGNIGKANHYLETVTKILPESPESLTNLARGRMAAGSIGAAIENLLTAQQHNLNSLDIKLLLAKAYQQSGQHDTAVAIIQKLKDKDPENVPLLNLYGTAVGLAGDHRKARESYLAALQIDENDITSLVHLSRMDVIEGHADKAILKLHKQLEKSPESSFLMLELGNTYKLNNDPENALFWYKKAYSIDGDNFATLSRLVEGFLINNDLKSALETASGFTENFPKHSQAYSLLGHLFEKANEPTRAIKNYKLAVEYAIKQGDALLTLANAELRLNKQKAARKTLQKALAWNPDLTDAYIALIKIAIDEADRADGFALLAHFRAITKEDNPAPDILSAELYAALKEYDKAEEFYQAALKIGDNPVAVLGLYRTYSQSGQRKKAIATMEDWHDKYPEDIRSALVLGTAYKQDKQIKKSVEFHDKLLENSPDMPIILNNAASVNFSLGNEDIALNYARKAHKILPDNPNILDTLAWIESQRGNPEIALPLLRKALVLRFSDPEIKYHLAMTLDKLSRRGEARKILAEAVASRIDFSEKDRARQTLKKWHTN